MIKNKRAKIRI